MFIVQLLIVQVVFFVALATVLRKLMSRHATTATAHLQGLSQEFMKKQDELKKRLEDAERLYQEQLTRAQEEVQQLKAQGMKDAESARQHTLDQTRQEAERIVQQAVQAREAMTRDARQQIDARAVERAAELFQTVLPPLLQEAAHAQWINELLKNGIIPTDRVQSREEIHEAQVVSAMPLSEAQRQQLRQRLEQALGKSITLRETVDASLMAGMKITAGHLVMDGSLASKLQTVIQHVQRAS